MRILVRNTGWAMGVLAALCFVTTQAGAQESSPFLIPADGLPDLPPLPPKRPPRQHVFLIPGYMLSLSPGVASESYSNAKGGTSYKSIATGHGVELSLSFIPAKSFASYGFFTQAQRFYSFNGDHGRYAAGVQGGYMVWGAEAGLAYRGPDDYRRGTPQFHLALFTSLIFLNISFQMAIPLVGPQGDRTAHALEGSMVFTFKAPISIL